MPYILYPAGLPATAWYHDLMLRVTVADLAEGRRGICARRLCPGAAEKGDGPTAEEARADRREMVSMYTGVSNQFVERSKLRIDDQPLFQGTPARTRTDRGPPRQPLHRPDRLGVREHAEYDPLLTNVHGSYTAGFYDYIRSELKFEFSDLAYEVLSGVCPSLVVRRIRERSTSCR